MRFCTEIDSEVYLPLSLLIPRGLRQAYMESLFREFSRALQEAHDQGHPHLAQAAIMTGHINITLGD